MKRALVVLHGGRPDAIELGRHLARTLAERGVVVEAGSEDAARLGGAAVDVGDSVPSDLDLVFALGGDGTLLRAGALAYKADVPLLGVNIGRLGFLAELEKEDLFPALARILDEGFAVEERLVIEGSVGDGGWRPIWALNDVIVAKNAVGRAISVAVSVGGEPFVTLTADGIVVATPTGSTAYSFSARGPIVSPRLDCLVVTPVSPHGLFDRSLVVSPGESVAVEVLSEPGSALLSLDGQEEILLPAGSVVRMHPGARRLKLAKVSPSPFWRLVRDKFRLADEARNGGYRSAGGVPEGPGAAGSA